MPYPRIWQYARFIGFRESYTVLIAYLQLFFFLMSTAYVYANIQGKYITIFLAILISPSILFCVERGNIDLLVYSFTVLFILFLTKRKVVSGVFLLFASITKIYPFFAIPALLTLDKKTGQRLLILVAILFFIYIGFSYGDLKQMALILEPKADLGFGWESFLLQLGPLNINWNVLAVLFILMTFLLAVFVFFKNEAHFSYWQPSRELNAFLVGSCIYCGLYILGSNHNYKLIFLLLCVPFLLQNIKVFSLNSVVMFFNLIVIILVVWYPFSHRILFFLKPPGHYYTLTRMIEHILHINLFFQFAVINLKFLKSKISDGSLGWLKS
jgi:hypothetical protein